MSVNSVNYTAPNLPLLQVDRRETKEHKGMQDPVDTEDQVTMIDVGPIFLSTNETDLERTHSILQQIPLCGNTVAAPGCLSTLDIASIERPSSEGNTAIEYVIAYDIHKRVQFVWEKIILSALTKAPTRQICIQLIPHLVELYWENIGSVNTLEKDLEIFKNRIARNISFLSSDERFDRIKAMAMQGRILFKPLDLFKPRQVERFLKWCDGQNMRLDTLSLSNISEYASVRRPETFIPTYEAFHASYESLPKNINIIHALRSEIDKFARQRVLLSEQRPRIPIMYTVFRNPINDYETTKTMIAYNASLEAPDDSGFTPLMTASEKGYAHALRALLEAGACVTAQNSKNMGATPLHCARSREAVELLIQYKADVNDSDAAGNTPLRIAADNGLPDVVAALLHSRADINVIDCAYGWTPLQSAQVFVGQPGNTPEREESLQQVIKILQDAASERDAE